MKGIYLVVPVWGTRHIEGWLRHSLPSLLSPGNLPALAKLLPVKMLLCTTRDDIPLLFGSPLVKALRDLIPVRAVPIADHTTQVTNFLYQMMNKCHNYGIAGAWQDDFGIIPGVADIIYADGALAEIGRQIAAGKRAALTQCPTVVEEDLDALLVIYSAEIQRSELALTIPARTLVRITRDGLQAISRSQIWESEHFTVHPSMLYWPLCEHGFLMRSRHLYPAFFYPDRQAKITTIIDGTFLDEAISDLGTCAALDDSDQYFSVVLANRARDEFILREVFHAGPAEIARWRAGNTKPFNRDLIRHKFWFHDGVDRAAWRRVGTASDQAIAATLEIFARNQAAGAP